MSAPVRPWYHAERVTVPSGRVTPDLTIKRSIVLDRWNAQRAAARGAAVQRDRLLQQQRAYAGADVSRLHSDWSAMQTSADSEILVSLRLLRARSRELVRDNPYAKHVVRLLVNNVVGGGMGMQAAVTNSRGKLEARINDSIEEAWAEWCDRKVCHTAGLLAFADIERLVMVQLVTAGEAIVRKVRQPFGGGNIPLALEVIEADRLIDQWQTAKAPNGNIIRMGVEQDEWGRPVAYWFHPKHPGDYQFTSFQPGKFLRVPADDIIHLYLIERWPQSRGEPWMHAALTTLHMSGGTEDALVVKARAAANVVGFIRQQEPDAGSARNEAGQDLIDTEPGTWRRLLPGEDVAGFAPVVADPSVDPFLRYLVRKVSVAVGISYEAVSRDYSSATYSSARMALLDDRDHYRALQGFIGRNLRLDIHREWCDAAALVGAIRVGTDYFTNPRRYQAMRLRPRGWSWIDPTKEVAAYRAAVRAGFMSTDDVIAQTGGGADREDVWKQRAAELEEAADLGLVFDTDPAAVHDTGVAQPGESSEGSQAEGEEKGATGELPEAGESDSEQEIKA